MLKTKYNIKFMTVKIQTIKMKQSWGDLYDLLIESTHTIYAILFFFVFFDFDKTQLYDYKWNEWKTKDESQSQSQTTTNNHKQPKKLSQSNKQQHPINLII